MVTSVTEPGITALIIDDEPLVCESIAAYLEDSGFTTLEAEDGREGLEVFGWYHFGVHLVVMRVDSVDVLDAMGAVCQESPETMVFLVSGVVCWADAIKPCD